MSPQYSPLLSPNHTFNGLLVEQLQLHFRTHCLSLNSFWELPRLSLKIHVVGSFITREWSQALCTTALNLSTGISLRCGRNGPFSVPHGARLTNIGLRNLWNAGHGWCTAWTCHVLRVQHILLLLLKVWWAWLLSLNWAIRHAVEMVIEASRCLRPRDKM